MAERPVQLSSDLEYSVQYFNFTPVSFINGFFNGLNDHVQEGLIDFHSKLRKIHPDGRLLNLTKPELVRKMRESFDNSFDKLEVYLTNNVLRVEPYVLLPGDEIHRDFPVSREDVTRKEEDIEKLKKQISELYDNEKDLKSELEEINSALESLQKLKSGMKKSLEIIQDEDGLLPLKNFKKQVLEDRLHLQNFSWDRSSADDEKDEHAGDVVE